MSKKSPAKIRINTKEKPVVVAPVNKYLGDTVSISLKYFKKTCECFSVWEKVELKNFSALLEKLLKQTSSQVKQNTNLCHAHQGKPNDSRFIRPEELSDDLTFYSLRVNHKSRIHGVFIEPVFFLIWLDREHACLKC